MMIIYYLFIAPALGPWCWGDGFCLSLSWPVESWSWLTWFRFDASINKCQIYSEDLVLLSPDCSRGGPLSVVKNITFQQQFFCVKCPKSCTGSLTPHFWWSLISISRPILPFIMPHLWGYEAIEAHLWIYSEEPWTRLNKEYPLSSLSWSILHARIQSQFLSRTGPVGQRSI